MNTLSEQAGFTLIETLVAIGVLTIGILTLYTMQISAIHGNSTAGQITRAATAGANQIEAIFAMNYDALLDVDGDGTGQDANNDGADDNTGNFGLQDAECCQGGNDPAGNPVAGCARMADGCALGFDGNAVYWNVAVDEPMPATKRVSVSVVRMDRGTRKAIEFPYIKAEVVQR